MKLDEAANKVNRKSLLPHCTLLTTASNISHALCAEVVWVAELVEGFNPFLEFSTNLLLWFINIIGGCGAAFLFHSLLRKLETVIQFSCFPIGELKVLGISYELNQLAGHFGRSPVTFDRKYFRHNQNNQLWDIFDEAAFKALVKVKKAIDKMSCFL